MNRNLDGFPSMTPNFVVFSLREVTPHSNATAASPPPDRVSTVRRVNTASLILKSNARNILYSNVCS